MDEHITIYLPNQLQKIVGQDSLVYYINGTEKGFDIKNLISKMITDYPLLDVRLLDKEHKINKFINIFVNDEDIRFLQGEDTFLKSNDIITFIAATAGG